MSADSNLCPVPPPDIFSSVGIDFEIAQAQFGKTSLGGIKIKDDPQIISLASKAANDDRIWAWYSCLEELRNGYDKCQVAWISRSRNFLKLNPSPDQYLKFLKEEPFPSGCESNAINSKNNIRKKTSEIQRVITSFSSINTWEKVDKWGAGNKIKFIDIGGSTLAEITSTKGRSAVWIESPKIKGPGKYILEAKIKAEDLLLMGKEHFERGKFQVVLVENGRDYEWPADNDFIGTDGWETKSVSIDLDKNETAVFRIGLQRTKGVVFVRDIKVYNTQ
jgi:hypothetical protein